MSGPTNETGLDAVREESEVLRIGTRVYRPCAGKPGEWEQREDGEWYDFDAGIYTGADLEAALTEIATLRAEAARRADDAALIEWAQEHEAMIEPSAHGGGRFCVTLFPPHAPEHPPFVRCSDSLRAALTWARDDHAAARQARAGATEGES